MPPWDYYLTIIYVLSNFLLTLDIFSATQTLNIVIIKNNDNIGFSSKNCHGREAQTLPLISVDVMRE
jgi:hypothetical protein